MTRANNMEIMLSVEKACTTLNQGVEIQENSILISGEKNHQQPV
jgi:hypothetical protein